MLGGTPVPVAHVQTQKLFAVIFLTLLTCSLVLPPPPIAPSTCALQQFMLRFCFVRGSSF